MLISKYYREFRQKYRPFFRAAKREMDSNMQKGLIDNIAAMAFNAGWRARERQSPQQAPSVKMRPWKGNAK